MNLEKDVRQWRPGYLSDDVRLDFVESEFDGEFENDLKTKAEVMQLWDKGWDCFLNALKGLSADQLSEIIYIRNEGHTVVEAINRQLAHYPYHIGQIVFYAKQLKSSAWDSLSIPRNASNSHNADKFSKEKNRKHFTDDEMKK